MGYLWPHSQGGVQLPDMVAGQLAQTQDTVPDHQSVPRCRPLPHPPDGELGPGSDTHPGQALRPHGRAGSLAERHLVAPITYQAGSGNCGCRGETSQGAEMALSDLQHPLHTSSYLENHQDRGQTTKKVTYTMVGF